MIDRFILMTIVILIFFVLFIISRSYESGLCVCKMPTSIKCLKNAGRITFWWTCIAGQMNSSAGYCNGLKLAKIFLCIPICPVLSKYLPCPAINACLLNFIKQCDSYALLSRKGLCNQFESWWFEYDDPVLTVGQFIFLSYLFGVLIDHP